MRDSDGSTGEEDEILGITRLNKRIVPVTPFSPGATHVGRKKWISLMSASVENDRVNLILARTLVYNLWCYKPPSGLGYLKVIGSGQLALIQVL
jgi:hypothetical protein